MTTGAEETIAVRIAVVTAAAADEAAERIPVVVERRRAARLRRGLARLWARHWNVRRRHRTS